jgi:hypothetical protein
VREDRPNVKVFVDGRLLNQFELVVEGRHLVQVHCPDAKLYNEWYTFGQAPNYYALCEGGTLGGGAVADAGGGGKGGKGGKKPDEGKEPKEPKEPRPDRDINMTRVAVMGAGGALFLGGAVLNFAAVNPTYAEIEAVRAAPATMNRAEADALSAQFNLLRFSTMGLSGRRRRGARRRVLRDRRHGAPGEPRGRRAHGALLTSTPEAARRAA